MPQLIYGTAWKKERTEALVIQALRAGFRGIDTACQPKHYHEPGVGAALAASLRDGLTREQIYLQTKFTPLSGQDPKRIPYDANASLPEQVAQSFAVSLRNLQTSYLDALVLHSPLPREAETLQVWTAMEALVDAGGVKRIGISNCYSLKTLEALYRASRIKPSVVQNRFYAESDYDIDVRAFCLAHDISYQSFWTLTANPHLLEDETVRLLTLKYRRTPAQVLFRYLTQVGVTPLTGTKSEAHMREDLDILQFELTGSEIAAITTLL
jgi:diketogulonate reductase-like aldo/keto reductase